LGTEFRKGYQQRAYLCGIPPEIKAYSVFIRLFSDLSPGSMRAKIAGELKNLADKGCFICYFEVSGTLYSWDYDELRGIIGKKSPGPASAEPGSAEEAIRGRHPSDFNPLPPPPVAL
jgi:hypothetical protein